MELMNDLETSKLFVGEINVRKSVGDITELKLSIQEKGILQPFIVQAAETTNTKLSSAQDATRPRKPLGLKKVPVIVRPLNDAEALSVSLVENIQRNDLELEEEAEGILKLMKLEPKRFASVKTVAKTLGRSESALRELLDAYELTFKLREGGMNIHAARAPPEEERKRAEAIPIKHTELVARALKTEGVRRLPTKDFERKVPEIVRAIAPLPEADARKVVDRFKMFPERSIQKSKKKHSPSRQGLPSKSTLPPKSARALDQAVRRTRHVRRRTRLHRCGGMARSQRLSKVCLVHFKSARSIP